MATYGQIARLAGFPRRARLVGYALQVMPEGERAPWQRVVNASGGISARPHPYAERQQRELLENEGVVFGAGGRISLSRFRWQAVARVPAEYRIRAPRAGERPGVYALGRDVWGAGLSAAEYQAACAKSKKYRTGEWRVLERGGVLLSALIVHPLRAEPAGAAAGLGSIATAPEMRRRGCAAGLIRGVLAELDARGVAVVYLHSDIAPAYYRRFGFRALPARLQRSARSTCMVRGGPRRFPRGFRAPGYF